MFVYGTIPANETSRKRRFLMPRHVPFCWNEQGLGGKTGDVGWRRVLPVPFFTGSLPRFRLVVHNSLERDREVEYHWTLERLSDESQRVASLAYGQASLMVRKQSKSGCAFSTQYLERDGSYRLGLSLKVVSDDGSPASAYTTVVYFDVLLRDATLTNWRINILMLVLGAVAGGIVGGIVGWITGHTR